MASPATRPPPPAKRGSGAFGMAKAVQDATVARPVILEVQPVGPPREVYIERTAKGISGPVTRYGVLPLDVTGDDDDAAAEGVGAEEDDAAALGAEEHDAA